MKNASWTFAVDGVDRQISAETDAASGRTAIRVDGRMAGRPLMPGEDEREFTIGSGRFILRRLPDDSLDLDFAPPDFSPGAPEWKGTRPGLARPAEKVVKSGGGVPVGRIIFGVLAALAIGAVIRYGAGIVKYLRVPWQSYNHHAQFRVKFAGEPEITGESVGGYSGQKFVSRYGDHVYILEYVQLPEVIPDERVGYILPEVLRNVMRREKADLLKNGWTHVSGHDALTFTAQFPESKRWSQGTARGHLIVHKNRLYVIYAYTPLRESLSFDVGEYLRSLELPDAKP